MATARGRLHPQGVLGFRGETGVNGDVDGTAEAIRPVLDLPATHRNNGIVVSALRVRHALMSTPAHTAVVARDLRAEIEAFPASRPALPRG